MSMISVNDLFYGRRESVLILKDEDKEILETIHRYNYFYAEPEPKPVENADGEDDSETKEDQGKEASEDKGDKENSNSDEKKPKAAEAADSAGKIVFKVPICCHDCEEFVTFALKKVDGVEDVDTFLPKRKVTVSGTAAPTSLLLACRNLKLFRKARLWSDDTD